MYRSSFRLSIRPARRSCRGGGTACGPGISTASWISPTETLAPRAHEKEEHLETGQMGERLERLDVRLIGVELRQR